MNQSETRICQNCKNQFTIEPEDFEFYEKVKVPPPTFCPECRLQRRLVFRNERILYKRKCDLCKEGVVSRYGPGVGFPVYCNPCWYSDKWDPLGYGTGYDFSRSFSAQYLELKNKVPHPALFAKRAINSDYCNQCLDVKDVYLSSSVLWSEKVHYSYRIDNSKDIFDTAFCKQGEQCYEVVDSTNVNKVFFSRYVKDSYDSEFLYDVRGSNSCLGCINSRNVRYQIFNKQLSPDKYREEINSRYNLGSYKVFTETKKKFGLFLESFPRRFALLDQTINVLGDNLQNAKNCYFCFDSYDVEDSKYILAAIKGVKNCYDCNHAGDGSELCYDGHSLIGSRLKFCGIVNGHDNEYSEFCSGEPTYLFGCISLRSKVSYCILNKRYSKEEYEKLVPRIIQHINDMPYVDKKGRVYKYGEFFPSELSPFAYNETVAQEYFPLTKEQALEQGYRWKEPEERQYEITKEPEHLPDHIKDVDDSILKETIGCVHQGTCNEQCTTAFRLIPQELEFYRKMNLPLPRLCPNCRHYQRLKQRNPLKFWHRKCTCAGVQSENGVYKNTAEHSHKSSHCPNEFETSYAPDRPEIVYCEACYNAEIV